MSSRLFVCALVAMVSAGCVEVDPVDFACPGLVNDGGAVATDAGDAEDAGNDACSAVTEPLDACDNEGAITNSLDGTCFWEQCQGGERSLFKKPPGVPCVYRPGGTSDWTVGACDFDAACTSGFIGGPK